MALRCIIGHDYGDTQTTRDTRERGNEVMVTVREYRECSRCGHQRIITENKEIKAGESAAASDEPESATASVEPQASLDDGTLDTGVGGPSGGLGEHEELTAEEDDGIILEDDSERSARGRGEWPDDAGESGNLGDPEAPGVDRTPWPDEVGSDEGYDAQPTGDDVDAGVSFGGGLAPEELDDADETPAEAEDDGGADIIDAEAHTAATGDTSSAAADRPGKFTGPPEAPPDHRDTEFVCPECGATWPTVDASLRPGDICPRCRQGYLAEQVVQ